ncbi:MAG: OmpH family outer membrane protein [Sphingobacteriales bacterium]|nr:MAG: OmpH family outer membrane protein [Sphingobacteriales bacterium]
MKNILPAITAILAALVGVLFYLHFKNHSQIDKISTKVAGNDTAANRPLKIAYVDLDSIQEKYDYYREKMTEFEKKKEGADRDLNNSFQRIENERVAFVQRGNSITQVEAEAFQRDYARKMQNLEQQKANMERQIQEEGIKTMEELKKKINAFLTDYNTTKSYSYIFSYSSGINVLFYKDTAYNITNEVVAGLNQAYKATKTAK